MSVSTETRNVAVEESKMDSEVSEDTLVVLEFSPKALAETKDWLTALIRAPGIQPKIIIHSQYISYSYNGGGSCKIIYFEG